MRKAILLAATLLILIPSPSYPQVRINARFDVSRSVINGKEMMFTWDGKEIEIEKEFKRNRLLLSGFAIGIRKEGRILIDGNYLYARTYRKYNIGKWELAPSLSVIYGDPGLRFESTEFNNGAYVHVNLVRNIGIPNYGVERAAVLYPEISVALRRKLKRFNIEPVAGVRIMHYGILRSDYHDGTYKEKIILSPSVGLRLGLKF